MAQTTLFEKKYHRVPTQRFLWVFGNVRKGLIWAPAQAPLKSSFLRTMGRALQKMKTLEKPKDLSCFFILDSPQQGGNVSLYIVTNQKFPQASQCFIKSFVSKNVVPSNCEGARLCPMPNSQIHSSKLVFYKLLFILREPMQESASTLI